MKNLASFSMLLLTTALIGCGGDNTSTPDQIAHKKAQQGVASESQPGDPVFFNGLPDFTLFTDTSNLFRIDVGFTTGGQTFIKTNNLQREYDEFIKNRNKLDEMLQKNSSSSEVGTTYKKAADSSYALATQIINIRAKEFQKIDFIGDLTTAPNWTPFKQLGRILSYFPASQLLDRLDKVDYFLISNLYQKIKIDAARTSNPKAFENSLPLMKAYKEAKAAYTNIVNAPLTSAALKPQTVGSPYPHEKRSFLQEIYYRATKDRVGKILTSTPVTSSDHKLDINAVSSRGNEILNGLNTAIKPFGTLRGSSNRIHTWHNYFTDVCRAEMRGNYLPIDIFSAYEHFKNFRFENAYLKQKIEEAGYSIKDKLDLYRRWKIDTPDNKGDNTAIISRNKDPNYIYMLIVGKYGGNVSIPSEVAILSSMIGDLERAIANCLKGFPEFKELFQPLSPPTSILKSLSNVSLRQARISGNGVVNLAAFNVNGSAGQSVELGLPLFVQLKGDVSSAKSTEAVTGSVAYRLGNTVLGVIQGYANSGAGFEADSTQRETSLVASQSFGAFFVEGQIGSVSATNVHNHDWSGLRSQLTVGFDAEFVSPFLQLTHRQLERSGINLSETTGYVGLNMNVAKLAADTYSIDTHLQAKAGYGSKDASMAGFKDHVSTAGFKGSVEWSASLNLNSGVAFSSNLALDTVAGSSAGLTVSLDR